MQGQTQAENRLPGTLDWQLTRFQFDYPGHMQASPIIRGLRSSTIEGYASRTSVYPGDTLELMVSVQPEASFEIDIYRMGYYDGLGGRHLLHLGPFEGRRQPMPMETIERLRECDWEPAVTLTIPDDWASGVYLAKLTKGTAPHAQSYIVFVVKSRRRAQVLVQVSDLTWQAYNKWPGANSIYDDGTPDMWYTGDKVRVSFDRPYAKYCQIVDAPLSCGSGEFLLWEFPLAYWLEAEGYEVTYCSNLDTHHDPDLLLSCEVFISVGHDEYWTREMYDNVSRARDAGVSLLFLSGNTMYHEILPYARKEGEPFRSFARRRYFQDEQELMGASSFGPGYGDWTCVQPDHWVFEGTGMQAGDRIPGLIGWEYHGEPFKAIRGLEVLARSDLAGQQSEDPVRGFGVRPKGDGRHAAVLYPGPRGNWVFNAGTIWWAEGLSSPPGHIPAMGDIGRVQGPDRRVQQITRNLLAKCLSKGV